MQIPSKLNALTRFIDLFLSTTQDQTQIVQQGLTRSHIVNYSVSFETLPSQVFSRTLNKTHVMCNCKTSQSLWRIC